ncbi:MAG: helix-turn-helix domain-containing protein [Nitriliruptoraceae bacterium]
MTVEQAGKLLGISRRSAYRAAASGDIPIIRLGHRILVPTAHLHRMLGLSENHDSIADTQRSDRNTGHGDLDGGRFSPAMKR